MTLPNKTCKARHRKRDREGGPGRKREKGYLFYTHLRISSGVAIANFFLIIL